MNLSRSLKWGSSAILPALIIANLSSCAKAPSATHSARKTAALSTSEGMGTATLSWMPPRRNADGSGLTDRAGYYIYYGTDPTNLGSVIKIPDPLVTTYTIDKLGSGTYYFRVEAFTSTGIHGVSSTIVSKVIP
jgi:hypothetical protein